MSIVIGPESIIMSGVLAPIRMAPFPTVETIQSEWVGNQPHVAGSQIKILVANETDVFNAVPSILIRNHHRSFHHRLWSDVDRLRSDVNRLRRRNDDGCEGHPPVRTNHAAREEDNSSSRNGQETHG